MFRAVDYDDGLHRGYELGRGLSWDAVMAWRAALTRWLPHQRPLAVLELGSGTGRFSRFIADVGGGRVYAVEPSHRMRAIAVAEHRHDRVHCLAGRAEAIPLAAASCDAAVLFFVLHHVADLEAAAGELARVLRDGGRVLVAGSFSERLHPRTYYRYLPRAREIESELFPKLEDVARTFGKTGLTITGFDEVEHEVADSLASYRSRLGYRAISTFEHMTEDEINEGLSRLSTDADAEHGLQPVRHVHDLVTFSLS